MGKMAVVLLAGWAMAATALLAVSQAQAPGQGQLLRVSAVGPVQPQVISGTLVSFSRSVRTQGEARYFKGITPFEMEVGPDFALALIERERGTGQLQVSLSPRDGGEPLAMGVGRRIFVGNNLGIAPGSVLIRSW